MSDQIKKAMKEGFVTTSEEMKKVVEDIKSKNKRYQTKEHPSEKSKKKEVEPQKQNTDMRQAVINPDADGDVPALEDEVVEEDKEDEGEDAEKEDSSEEEVVRVKEPRNREKPKTQEKKRKSTTEMAQEAYERYLDDSDRGTPLEAKMMRCMEFFLDM